MRPVAPGGDAAPAKRPRPGGAGDGGAAPAKDPRPVAPAVAISADVAALGEAAKDQRIAELEAEVAALSKLN